jgi:ATP-dependent DNA ligase
MDVVARVLGIGAILLPSAVLAGGELSGRSRVLDGEVAIYDQQLRSRFAWPRGTPDEVATPPMYIAFDVVYWAGEDVTGRPLQDRRVLLENAVAGGDALAGTASGG